MSGETCGFKLPIEEDFYEKEEGVWECIPDRSENAPDFFRYSRFCISNVNRDQYEGILIPVSGRPIISGIFGNNFKDCYVKLMDGVVKMALKKE